MVEMDEFAYGVNVLLFLCFCTLKKYSPKIAICLLYQFKPVYTLAFCENKEGLFTLHHTVKLKEGTGAAMLLNGPEEIFVVCVAHT